MARSDSPTTMDSGLAARLDPILHKLDASGAVFGARVVEISTGRELYAHNPDRPLAPASNGKLANDASGLDHFGSKHTFKTYLALDGDDLWIIGTGDPGCGDEDIAKTKNAKPTTMLDEWSSALKAHGVSHVKGKLYFFDGIFEDQLTAPTWSRGYLTDWYAAPISGLTFNDNCIDVTVYPTGTNQPARYEVMPPVSEAVVKIVNQTRSGGRNGTLAIDREQDSNVFTLTGPVTKKDRAESKPVTDPGAFFADAVRTNLQTHGITIDGPTQRAARTITESKWAALINKPLNDDSATAPDSRIISVHETAMTDVMWRINKNSQNLFAEAMCKLQGRDWALAHGRNEPGSWALGSEAIHDFLRRNKIDDSQYVLVDGSGLSRENRVTTRLITDLFIVMAKHPYAQAFHDSLTICGKDGTLKKRMKDIAGMVRGKTGSIGGVRAVSGYATTRSGQTLVFSIIFNEAHHSEEECEKLADEALHVVVDWPNFPATKPATAPH